MKLLSDNYILHVINTLKGMVEKQRRLYLGSLAKTYTKAQTTIHGTAQLQKRSFESQGTKKKSRLVLAKGFYWDAGLK